MSESWAQGKRCKSGDPRQNLKILFCLAEIQGVEMRVRVAGPKMLMVMMLEKVMKTRLRGPG